MLQAQRGEEAVATPVISARFDALGADGRPCRLGIMGGTFDPIHIGHLACAEQAREAYQLDAVIFIPTGMPAFKCDQRVTEAEHRLAMCRLACDSNPYFDVSDIEVMREGITYAVDTLRQLRTHYPENVEIFFITGADSILSIACWHESAALAELARFIAVTRPGYVVEDAFKSELAQPNGFQVDYLEMTELAISSSDLRERMKRGQSIRYLTTPPVCEYISQHGLYGEGVSSSVIQRSEATKNPARLEDAGMCDGSRQALTPEFFAARKNELEGRVSPKRLKHIMGVAKAAKNLAETYDVDVRKARLAGLLHDWDKNYDDEEIRDRVANLGLNKVLDPWVVKNMPRVLHAHTAAAALERDFPEIPADVIQAIDRHTTAAVDMTPLDMVVYIADAIEETRQFGEIDALRAKVGAVSLDELFFEVYKYWTFLLIERGKTLHPDTITVWNAYAVKNGCQKGYQRDR